MTIAGKCPVHKVLAGGRRDLELADLGRACGPRPRRPDCAVTGASRGIGREVSRAMLCEAGANVAADRPRRGACCAKPPSGPRTERARERSRWPSTSPTRAPPSRRSPSPATASGSRRPRQQRRRRQLARPRRGPRRGLARRLGAQRDGADAADGRHRSRRWPSAGWGRVVNVSSTAGKRPSAQMPEYSVAKAAQLSLSRLYRRPPRCGGGARQRDLPGPDQVRDVDGAGRPARPVARRATRPRRRARSRRGQAADRPARRGRRDRRRRSPSSAPSEASYVAGAAWSVDGGTVQVII